MSRTASVLYSNYYDVPEVSAIINNREQVGMAIIADNYRRFQNTPVAYISKADPTVLIPVNMDVPEDTAETLYRHGTDSKVGKGHETVLDKSIRSSKEYCGDCIRWDDNFVKTVGEHVEKTLQEMNAGRLISIKPHKLVIYGKDDFFSEHMDATHTPGQTMTAVVELSADWWAYREWGGLRVNGDSMSLEGKEINLIVFDHDLPHSVDKIEDGYRISVTFDLVVEAQEEKQVDVTPAIQKLKSLGVKKVGFFCTQRYLEDQNLKGSDRRVVDAFAPHTIKVETHNLCTDDCQKWYRQEVWNLMNSGPECGSLMYEVEHYSDCSDDCGEETYHGEYYEKPEEPRKSDFPKKWSPETDDDEIVREEYCLGNMFLMWSPHHPTHTMKGNDEVHLGNEGFGGDVHENLFVAMTLK